MDELNIVSRRRQEVLDNMAKARDTIEVAKHVLTEGEAELLDLDVAGRTIARLTGASWPPDGEADAKPEASNVGRVRVVEEASVKPTMPEMIETALQAALGLGVRAMEPKAIASYIDQIFHNKPDGAYVSSIVWRMWKRGQLRKTQAGTYMLPSETNEATDLLSSPDQSAASDLQPNRTNDREVASGGGT